MPRRVAALATLAAAVVAPVALALPAGAGSAPHVHSDSRPAVVVEDRTGSGAWSAAVTHAVREWNRSGAVQITARQGSGSCDQPVMGVLLFCQKPRTQLGGGAQGVAYPYASNGHIVAGIAIGCSDCAGDARKRVIATHEIGHLLGLVHTNDRTSVMCHTGCAERPNGADLGTLQANHGHADRSTSMGSRTSGRQTCLVVCL